MAGCSWIVDNDHRNRDGAKYLGLDVGAAGS